MVSREMVILIFFFLKIFEPHYKLSLSMELCCSSVEGEQRVTVLNHNKIGVLR